MDNDDSLRQRRARAEAWLAGQPPVAAPAWRDDELRHELRVLQIELELQTEDWRAAQSALAQARERCAELYELAPVAYLTLTRGGVVAAANVAAATLLGVARRQLLDERFDRFVAPADGDLWRQRLAAVTQDERQNFEMALRNPAAASSSCRVLAECRCLASDSGATVHLTLTDISGRYATEDQLRKLSLAVEQSPESIVITNLAGEIEYVNEAFVRIAGYPREALVGRNMSLLQSGRTPRATYAAMWDALGHGRDWHGEFINRREDGSEYVEHASISPLRQPDGRITHYVAVKQCLDERRRHPAGGAPTGVRS